MAVDQPSPSPLIRRRAGGGLSRVIGVPGLFATAYGNVGSSIYYALGLVAIHAYGLTPAVFLLAGALFATTAYTYAEGASMFPEAGGSSSFARHAFNEAASFFAGWALTLDYIITIAISAIFVPHYLGAFWSPLLSPRYAVVGGIIVIILLAVVNIRGVKESAKLNVFLAVTDLFTQIVLVLLGALLIFRPEKLITNVHFGVAPSLGQFIFGLSLGMIAYTGIETVSNMAEEARNPDVDIPRAVNFVLGAVLSLYAGISIIAMMALPVFKDSHGHYTTLLAQAPPKGYAEDPVLGIISQLPVHALVTGLRYYVGILAATILVIATNAGIIGVSRLTYSLSQHYQLPAIASRIHPKYQTPYVTVVFYALIASALLVPGLFFPNESTFLGDMYSYGAMLSFTTAHVAIIALRWKDPDRRRPFSIKGNINVRGRSLPIPAMIGALGTSAAWVTVVVLHVAARYVGTAWMIAGGISYVLYRRQQGLSLTEKRRRVISAGLPQAEVSFRSLLLPVDARREHVQLGALEHACELAADEKAYLTVLAFIEVPRELPLRWNLPELERNADRLIAEARAVGEQYGVRVHGTLIKTRNPAASIVEEARARDVQLILLGSEQRRSERRPTAAFSRIAESVLRRADRRVQVFLEPRQAQA